MAVPPRRKGRRRLGFFVILLAMGTFAYLVFASVARLFFGAWGFLLVTAIVVALLVPPYSYAHRQRKQRRKPPAFYRPLPRKVPGQRSSVRLEAEILASFILGAAALIMYIVGNFAQTISAIGGYSDLGPEAVGLVLTWFAIAVLHAWFWTQVSLYDPYDPDSFL